MLRFRVKKNGVFVGRSFDSYEKAIQLAEIEKQEDPSANVQVQPVLTVVEELDPSDGEALVEAILEGEDFSELSPEHRGALNPPEEELDEEAADVVGDDAAKGKKPIKHGKRSNATAEEGFSFFVRHPSGIPVADEVLEELWAQDTIAVHLPDGGENSEGPKHANPQKHWDKMAAKHFAELAEGGGYVWCESRVRRGVAKVGRVVSQQPGELGATWTSPKHYRHAGGAGSEVFLRTLRLEGVKEIDYEEAASLRSVKPLARTLQRWNAVGSRLEALVEGTPLDRNWSNLTPLQQRAVCVEFLRSHQKPEYPKLGLLLAPDGVKLEPVDILGMEEDGTEILARVTSLQKDSKRVKWEARALKKHYGPGRSLLLFCSFSGSMDTAGSDPSLFPLEPFQVLSEDGVLFVPVEEVFKWVKSQDVYADKLFSL